MLTRWTDPQSSLSVFDDLRRQMDRFFDDFRVGFPNLERNDFFKQMPKSELKDEGDHVSITVEMPGLTEKDVHVNLHENMLIIKGSRTEDKKDEKDGKMTSHSSYEFNRTFGLAGKFDTEKSHAELKNGVLSIRLERTPESRPRQIPVKASK